MRVNVVLRVAVCSLVVGVGTAHAQNDEASRSVLDGVYAKDQAAAGRTTFSEVCANCHTSGQFAGPAFQSTWAGRNVRSLFRLIRTTMPYEDPGGLTREEYAAITAYILEQNGYPPGDAELPTEDAALTEIRFEPRPDSGTRSQNRLPSRTDTSAGHGEAGRRAAGRGAAPGR